MELDICPQYCISQDVAAHLVLAAVEKIQEML